MEYKFLKKSNLGAMNELIEFEEKNHALEFSEVPN